MATKQVHSPKGIQILELDKAEEKELKQRKKNASKKMEQEKKDRLIHEEEQKIIREMAIERLKKQGKI